MCWQLKNGFDEKVDLQSILACHLALRPLHFCATGMATLQSGLIVELPVFATSGAEILPAGCALGVVRPGVSPHAVGTRIQVNVSVRHLPFVCCFKAVKLVSRILWLEKECIFDL